MSFTFFSVSCMMLPMNPRIRAYALRVWDLICSLGAPPYSYDPKGTFSNREIHPRTYSLRKAIQLSERWRIPPASVTQARGDSLRVEIGWWVSPDAVVYLPPRRGSAKGTKGPRLQYSHVFINRALSSVLYVNGKPQYPEAIKRRLLP